MFKDSASDGLIFNAKLISDISTDKNRIFGLTFFPPDSSVTVVEGRSNGCESPGRFLSRIRPTNPATGKLYTTSQVHVGARIHVAGRIFELADAPEYTLNLMEAHPDKYPESDINKALSNLVSVIQSKKGSQIDTVFEESDPTHSGSVTKEEAEHILFSLAPDLSKNAAITLIRRFTHNSHFDYETMNKYSHF